jgi:primosomal protein N'
VPINFNNREIEAVVLESVSLKDAKVEIRKADFQTKKIEKRLGKEKEKSLDKKLLKILTVFSEEFIIPVGEIIHFLNIPLARRGESQESVTFYPDDLSLKIEKKENAFRGRDMFLQILTNKIETLIIKDFNFSKYLNFQSPHISKLHLLLMFVKEFGKIKKIILETGNLGVAESVWLSENIKKEKLFGKFEVEIKENTNTAKKFVIKTGKDKNGEDEILSSKAIELFSPPESPGGGKIFVFVLSHGYADRIFCKDCQASYNCENCEHPFSILNEEEERFLYCKNCKNKKLLLPDQYLICKKCGSWRIFPFGVGVQRTKEFLEKENIGNIVAIDESQKKLSVKKLEKEIQNFLSHPGTKVQVVP